MIGELLPFGAERRRRIERLRERRIIEQSGLFEAAWYLDRNPDIAASGQDPLDHFLNFGASERRAAGPLFDTRLYIAAHPDIADGPINPLLHYLDNGAKAEPGFDTAAVHEFDSEHGSSREPKAVSFSIILRGDATSAGNDTLRSLTRQGDAIIEVIAGLRETQILPIRTISSSPDLCSLGAALVAAVNDYIILLDPGTCWWTGRWRRWRLSCQMPIATSCIPTSMVPAVLIVKRCQC